MQKIIKVCTGKRCSEKFSWYIIKRLEADKKFYHYDENIKIEPSACMGRCENWPNVNFGDEVIGQQNPIKSSEILRKKIEEWKKSN